MENTNKNIQRIEEKILKTPILIALMFFATAFQALFLFPVAGTILWIEGWVYLVTFFILFSLVTLSLKKKNPEILINRMRHKKESFGRKRKIINDSPQNGEGYPDKELSAKASGTDRIILPIFGILFALVFILPGLDFRYNWSIVPMWVKIIGFIIFSVSLYILYLSMLQNAYASKVLDVREGQKLIDTGLYGIIRHPLYFGFALMVLGLAFALGSWYAIIPAILSVLMLVIRIHYEELMLEKSLAGYEEYQNKVKFKLIPYLY